ncbi:MAG: hypothetical protein HWE07_04355, partial [Cytophagia bacterium]|nr:hypothetical protein [Cytophagia bacterium]
AGSTDDFTVVLDAKPGSNVVINVSSGDTGEATVNVASLTFTAANWSIPQTITVTGTDDSDFDGSQTTTITLSIDAGSSDDDFDALSDQSVSVTTTDDDAAQISVDDPTVSEGDAGSTTLSFTVSLNSASPGTVTVDVETSDGSATAGSDYTALSSTTLTFSAGETSKTVDVTLTGDEVVELDETITLTLSNNTGASLISDNEGTGTITNDDQTSVEVFSTTSIDEEVGTVDVVLTLNGAVQGGLSVDLSNNGGLATVGDDYESFDGTTVSFNGDAGETKILTIVILDDEIVEATESIEIVMSNLQSSVSSSDIDILSGGRVAIRNTDEAQLSIGDKTVNEGDGTINFTVTLDKDVDGGFSVDINTFDETALVSDDDYTSIINKTLTFNGNAGETQGFTLDITSDAKVESDETLSVRFESSQPNTVNSNFVSGVNAIVTIVNDDSASITVGDVDFDEEDGVASVELTLDNEVDGGFQVKVSTVDGSATLADDDYELNESNVAFDGTPGEKKTFEVQINSDSKVESDETIVITLSDLVLYAITSDDIDISDEGSVTINNNDKAIITIADRTLEENDGPVTVFVELDNEVDGGFTIDVSTVDGTATTSDSDYTSVSSYTLTFEGTEGESKSFEISFVPDSKLEADETLTVAMSNLVPVTVNSADIDITDGATVTIANDDTASVTIADVDGNEDDGAITLTATLDNQVDGGFTVDVSTVDGTATTADSDYTAVTSRTLTFTGTAGETQTFTVTPTADAVAEGTEKLTVSMSNLAGTSLGVDVSDQATVTIIGDDDGTAPVFENSTPSTRDIGGTDFTLDIDLDEAATAYYVVLTDGATAPTSAEVKAGTGSGGAAAVTSDSFDFFTGTYSNDLGVSGLSSETDYDVYVVGEDIAGNLMTNPTLVEITTPDVTSPTVTNVTSSTANGSYKVGDDINIQVVFSEVVILSDFTQLQIQLETGASDYYVAAVSGSGTNTINFTHIVQAGSEASDLDYKDTNSLDLSLSATLQDAAGNDAVLTLPTPGTANSLGSNKNIIIDTTAPNAPSVTSISNDTGVNGTDGKTNDNTITISGTLPESNVSIEVFVDGVSAGQAVVGLSEFTFDYTGTELEDGEYEITAKATDVAGNTGALSSVFN